MNISSIPHSFHRLCISSDKTLLLGLILRDMLVIIRFTLTERQTFEDVLLLNISFQRKLRVTFPLEIKKKSEEHLTTSYLSVSSSFLLSRLFNSLVFPHVPPHLLILKLCSVITWDSGGFIARSALCSFPSFLSRMQITIMLECYHWRSAPCSYVSILFPLRCSLSEASRRHHE